MNGKMIALEDANDGVFSEKVMGEGLAFTPNDGVVVAPCSGMLTTVFDTGHAYGIKRADGLEMLIHIGLETVGLKGKGFQVKVQQGQQVQQGQVLCEVDLAYLKSQGVRSETILMFPEADADKIKINGLGAVEKGKTIVADVKM